MNAPDPLAADHRRAARISSATASSRRTTAATLPMIDPSDGTPFASIARGGAADIDAAVRAAQRARDGAWGKLAPR